MSGPTDRPRGILTKNDRALLLGEIEYEHKQQYSNRRQDIRERIANGILDFSSIQYLLQDKDRKRIFAEPNNAAGVEDAQFHESIQAMFYWVYLGLKEQNYDFATLLSEAVEQAEVDFAQTYWGENVDVTVQFDVDVTRSQDIGDLISAIEHGGPVKSSRLYDLLQLSGGVPIDTSKLDTVRVWFESSYPDGERAVLETMFSDYLGVEVEIEDALDRVELEGPDGGRENAAVDPSRSRPDPSNIENHQSTIDFGPSKSASDEDPVHIPSRSLEDSNNHPDESDSIAMDVIEDTVEQLDSSPPTIRTIIAKEENGDRVSEPITPEYVLDLLKRVRDPFVSTIEVAAAYGCASDAARQALTELFKEEKVKRRSVLDDNGEDLTIWWLSS